ncbi:MAG: sigma-70 family RNA polymerase sigma factor [Clostridia bacterium]|nr:sigma-70 family RNA polymerase sigma factor [Clostridia bacterium]
MKQSYFDRVYESTYDNLLKYAMVHLSDPTDAEDAVQNVYVQFYRRIERYGHFDILSPEGFLKKMLKREIIKSYAEREQQRVRLISDADEDRIPDEEVFENAVVDRALAEEIFRTAKALPQETYRTFVLFYGFELTIPEIAEKLGVTKDTVKTRLYRARNALRAKLDADSQQNRQKGNGEY